MSLAERDKNAVWHPYTQMLTADLPIAITGGEGALLFAEDGKTYIDGVSSWYVNLHGHSHPYIAKKIAEQATKLEHVIFAGFTHNGAVEFAERLLKILPGKQSKVFYSDNGSTAVEVALKMALQLWYNRGIKKTKILAFEHSYHGDTFGAMSVSADGAFTAPFAPLLFDIIRIPVPFKENKEASLAALRKALQGDDVAAFIFEPVVMAVAGMLMYGAEELDELLAICKEKNVLTIADEVFTGFGRTGTLFASERLKNKPDIFCLSKGITGGFIPLGVTTCTEEVYKAFLSEDRMKTFFHGHSYTANPLACAAALASMDVLLGDECQNSIRRISARHVEFADSIRKHPVVREARTTGTVLAIEITTKTGTSYFSNIRDSLYNFFLDRGIVLRPLGNVVYFLPPYCTSDEQMDKVYGAIRELLEELRG
jgi:adenosylmethionine-8-amino-7-oxononanoate aminotransferase